MPVVNIRSEEVREAKRKRIGQQLTQTLKEMLAELPKACDRGTKCNDIQFIGFQCPLVEGLVGTVIEDHLTFLRINIDNCRQ